MPNLFNSFSNINDSLPNSSNSVIAPGSLSSNFAHNITAEAAQNFYNTVSTPDPYTIPKNGPNLLAKSIANKYALYNFRGFYGNLSGNIIPDYRDQPNNKLMGGDNSHNVSVSKIIQFFNQTYPRIGYKPSDFLYSKYYRKIPVNHLITLRRFPMPVNDNIYSLTATPQSDSNNPTQQKNVDATQTAGVTAVTYMGETAGNKMDEILNFSYGLNWKEIQSEMEAVATNQGGYTNQPFYNKIGRVGQAAADSIQGVSSGQKFAAQQLEGEDRLGTTFANFVMGPINVIDKTTIRDRGINFANDLKLSFEYELKSLNYVNPKIAMIDIISNMLTLTTNNAAFWGGGHRYYGSQGFVSNSFGDVNKLRKGDFAGYIGTVVNDVESGFKGLFGSGDGSFLENPFEAIKNVGSTGIGNLLGSFLGEQLGGNMGMQATKALISGEPTGNWHVTVGNPLNPIVTMGNMYCDNTTMTLGEGLGYDDFPMEVKFITDVKHAKPRDKGDIENMFNSGQGRIYASSDEFKDINNLSGDEVQTYGNISNIGTGSREKTQSAPGIGSDDISNENLNTNTTNQIGLLSDDDPEYTANLVAMMIDS